ncbi:MAG: hypothetical protein OHK0039_45710 [Bacteroidia bacterium]
MMRTIHLRIACLYLCLLGSVCSVYGQSREYVRGTSGRIEAGPSFLQLAALNETLVAQRYAAVPQNLFALGLAMQRVHKRWYTGASMYNYLVSQSSIDDQKAVLGYHYFTLRAGVRAHWGEQWQVFPAVGLGAGLLRFQAKPINQSLPTSYWTGGPLAELSLHATRITPLDPEKGYFVETGFTAGYLRAFENVWILRGFPLDEQGVGASPQGFFLRFTLGMGKWTSQTH